jgi:sugar lactone lactonase YvrE
MAQFELNGESYLVIADVGDNQRNRSSCQIYLLREPNLGIDGILPPNFRKLPVQKAVNATKLEFKYPEGPRDCEAVAVDVLAKQIWLTEKVYYNAPRSESPGIYVLPLTFTPTIKPLVARRIADFPIRNATGMAFSPDGKRLIIRNYLNAHLYSRNEDESWADVVSRTKPKVVVLPLQRQGEAICFTPDSKSVILTSETKRQTIWQVNLQLDVERSGGKARDPDPNPPAADKD